jgi:nucleotide-binding universal stress UspA family protein
LAATDLLEPSLPVVAAAAEEARRRHVALTVVHAVDIPQDRESSLPAVVAGVGEARRLEAAPKVAHVVDLTQLEAFFLAGLGTPTGTVPSSVRDAAHDRLATWMQNAGVSANRRILDGPAAVAIVREARHICADLIVVGSHGSTGFARIVLGDVPEEIVRAAPCSVLLVRFARS